MFSNTVTDRPEFNVYVDKKFYLISFNTGRNL